METELIVKYNFYTAHLCVGLCAAEVALNHIYYETDLITGMLRSQQGYKEFPDISASLKAIDLISSVIRGILFSRDRMFR